MKCSRTGGNMKKLTFFTFLLLSSAAHAEEFIGIECKPLRPNAANIRYVFDQQGHAQRLTSPDQISHGFTRSAGVRNDKLVVFLDTIDGDAEGSSIEISRTSGEAYLRMDAYTVRSGHTESAVGKAYLYGHPRQACVWWVSNPLTSTTITSGVKAGGPSWLL